MFARNRLLFATKLFKYAKIEFQMRNDDYLLRGGIPRSLWSELCVTPQNDSSQRARLIRKPRGCSGNSSHITSDRGVTLSYHLSINRERRPQQYRPSGLLKIPIKSTLESLLEKLWNIQSPSPRDCDCFSTMAMDILWRNARTFCQLYLSFTRKRNWHLK